MYLVAKHLHLLAIGLSAVLFLFRFVFSQLKHPLASHKAIAIITHITYTLLVVTAAWLCLQLSMYPFTTPWLTAKLIGLAAFILFGLVAFKWARTRPFQWLGFLGALAALAITAKVAYLKQPFWF